MSTFIKNNKFMIHVVSEVVCLCGIVMFISRNNKSIYDHIQHLEDKIAIQKSKLERHEQLFQKLLRERSEPIMRPTTIPVQQRNTYTPNAIDETIQNVVNSMFSTSFTPKQEIPIVSERKLNQNETEFITINHQQPLSRKTQPFENVSNEIVGNTEGNVEGNIGDAEGDLDDVIEKELEVIRQKRRSEILEKEVESSTNQQAVLDNE